jgi:hypothetical protein
MTGDPHRHTKSEGLKRLLRRRGRRGKSGANSGETVYSWAEYGPVNFTPSGDHSKLSTIVGALAVMGSLLIVPAIFFLAGSAEEEGLRPYLEGFLGALAVVSMIAVFCLPMVIPTALLAWIYARLDGNGKKDRERLIAAADTLRARQLDAQDESANHAR